MTRSRSDPLPGNRLAKAILSLHPTAYWPLDDGGSPLRDVSRGWSATVTGSPSYGVAAPSPIGRGVTFSGTGQYAATATSIPTPATSMSVLALFATSDATAASRFLASRGASSQYSWGLHLQSNHTIGGLVYQNTGSIHASVGVSGTVNDGAWHLAGMTFDGTTLRGYKDSATNSSTSLTGSWHKASTGPVRIAAAGNAGSLWIGTEACVVYWADRVLTAAEFLFLNAIARGG